MWVRLQQAKQPPPLPPMNCLDWRCRGCCRWCGRVAQCNLHLTCLCMRVQSFAVAPVPSRVWLHQGFDDERARPALEEALKPRTRKGKTLPNKMDLEQLVGR